MTKVRDVARDSFDFRDLIYQPALVKLRDELYPRWQLLHILDQKNQGACTGFGLAATINYLNGVRGDSARVSARMLFEMAKRYDQWPGEKYDFSSARGAMKGWYKHGVCSESLWPNQPVKGKPAHLTLERQNEALKCPLGAYYRILPRRNDVHAALNEVGTVYAAADTHDGWDKANGQSEIGFKPGATGGGGHAFAIIGYTGDGFLVQNSWGTKWGGFRDREGATHGGVALWRYEDFDLNVWDLWVARTALPVATLAALRGTRYTHSPAGTRVTVSGPPVHEIWNHFVHIDDGQYDPKGEYPSHREEVEAIVGRLVQGEDGTPPAHLVLYAHGGLNTVDDAARRVGKWRPVFKGNGVAELHFIWETGLLPELRDVILGKEKFAKERVAGVSDWWDTFLEKTTQPVGYPLWREMRTDAAVAFDDNGAGAHFLGTLRDALKSAGRKAPRLHLAGHSAGSIWMGHLLERWQTLKGPPIVNLVLYAPACTLEFFVDMIAPAIKKGTVAGMHHFLLDDKREQDDNVAVIYRKSLLYLVSRAYQSRKEVEPLLGMEKYMPDTLKALRQLKIDNKVFHYNTRANTNMTTSKSHGGFDNDLATMNSMLRLVLGAKPSRPFTKTELSGY
jgi:hypothetical protein